MTFCQFTKRFLDVTFRLAAYDIKSGKKRKKKDSHKQRRTLYLYHTSTCKKTSNNS